ncbi:hypothetical protein PCASD_14750 [Puccinia coronata f. sp. avenae]|uniref:Uncharacterized protein n=1 Tax=Puccinia coronata f. sp. avenae TaxID=200324 RepID=A0A2N5UAZ9_9BASI|nr:hypothetical protein PCASD_14750 [Puccinia coronata f. sp. avenae]
MQRLWQMEQELAFLVSAYGMELGSKDKQKSINIYRTWSGQDKQSEDGCGETQHEQQETEAARSVGSVGIFSVDQPGKIAKEVSKNNQVNENRIEEDGGSATCDRQKRPKCGSALKSRIQIRASRWLSDHWWWSRNRLAYGTGIGENNRHQ